MINKSNSKLIIYIPDNINAYIRVTQIDLSFQLNSHKLIAQTLYHILIHPPLKQDD